MVKRRGGFIGQAPFQAPDSPTSVSVSGGVDGVCSVSFTAPSDVGDDPITGYLAVSGTGFGATGGSSPISVSGLAAGTATTFNVFAINDYGHSSPAVTGSITPSASRAVFSGGADASSTTSNVIQFISPATTGDASDFGDMGRAMNSSSSFASSTRGCITVGFDGGHTDTLEFITIASTGNSTNFGTHYTHYAGAGLSSNTRGVIGGCRTNSTVRLDTMEFFTIASTGNSTDFGDLTVDRRLLGACASTTRGVFMGGIQSGTNETIDFITISSTGDASDFGDISTEGQEFGSCSNSTRGLRMGGSFSGGTGDLIEFITIASASNTTDFGDLTASRHNTAAAANSTRGICSGGINGSTRSNVLDFVTIASTGDASDFGDLLSVSDLQSGLCNAHGGI